MEFLEDVQVLVTELPTGNDVAFDVDVVCLGNSKTQEEGLSQTDQGYDGYPPIGASLGSEGWCLYCQMESEKCQSGLLSPQSVHRRVRAPGESRKESAAFERLDSPTPRGRVQAFWVGGSSHNVALYENRGVSEPFHSEIKMDLDLERLPSGKFSVNALVLSLGAKVYNVLRIIAQEALLGDDAPVPHPTKRRRIRTFIQELITLAARVIRTGRRSKLQFGRHCPGCATFRRLFVKFCLA